MVTIFIGKKTRDNPEKGANLKEVHKDKKWCLFLQLGFKIGKFKRKIKSAQKCTVIKISKIKQKM